jgi:hypothetical protein
VAAEVVFDTLAKTLGSYYCSRRLAWLSKCFVLETGEMSGVGGMPGGCSSRASKKMVVLDESVVVVGMGISCSYRYRDYRAIGGGGGCIGGDSSVWPYCHVLRANFAIVLCGCCIVGAIRQH